MSIETVFVSSVVGGFEAERQAARVGIEVLDLRPIMCEDFGARSYSSGIACISEVENSDAYILVMGTEFGFETDEGISVTQSEFRAARRANRPMLAFVQQAEYSGPQADFKQEVEAYQGGLFRESFTTADDLKDRVTRALNRLRSQSEAISPEQFETEADEAISLLSEDWQSDTDPELVLVYKPQPERRVNLANVESSLDSLFERMCRLGYCQMRDGYEVIGAAHWAGIKSGPTKVALFENGMLVLANLCAPPTEGYLPGKFIPPELLLKKGQKFLELIDGVSGFVHLGLRCMSNGYIAQPPSGTSFSMRMWGSEDDEHGFSRLFVPLSPGSYAEWVEHCVGSLRRKFPYETN